MSMGLSCLFGRSLSTRLGGRATFARDTQSFCVRCVLPPIGIICKMCCPLSDIVGRVRGMVVGQGSYKQKTLSVTRNMVV